MLGAALKDLKSRGAGEAYLNVFIENPAKQLYRKTGFQPHSEYMRAPLRKEAKVRKRKGKYQERAIHARRNQKLASLLGL